jgi:hypothetical protein
MDELYYQFNFKYRNLQTHNYKKLALFPTPGRGWGLQADEDIKCGEFVIEYVGEVLDAEMSQKRLLKQAQTNDEHVFHMELDTDRIIDARFKGNLSRFANHSCAANSELQKWNVKGHTRIAIYAKQDIPKGMEITYDYQFGSADVNLRCLCGAPTCRGTLAAVSLKRQREQAFDQGTADREKRIRELTAKHDGEIPLTLLREINAERKEFESQVERNTRRAKAQQLKDLCLIGATVPGDHSHDVSKGPIPFMPVLGSLQQEMFAKTIYAQIGDKGRPKSMRRRHNGKANEVVSKAGEALDTPAPVKSEAGLTRGGRRLGLSEEEQWRVTLHSRRPFNMRNAMVGTDFVRRLALRKRRLELMREQRSAEAVVGTLARGAAGGGARDEVVASADAAELLQGECVDTHNKGDAVGDSAKLLSAVVSDTDSVSLTSGEVVVKSN